MMVGCSCITGSAEINQVRSQQNELPHHEQMKSPIAEVLCRPEHLGRPIPDSPHAVSACLPNWQDNIGYEEGDARVVELLKTGYPRFVYNQYCVKLFQKCLQEFGQADEACLAFPTAATAEECARFIAQQSGQPCRVVAIDQSEVHAILFAKELAEVAKTAWQHLGTGITSRFAQACLNGACLNRMTSQATTTVKLEQTLKKRIAKITGMQAEQVWLFPTGMAAIAAAQRAVLQLDPRHNSVQFGFPYVDTLKLQQKIGPGVYFYPRGDRHDLSELTELLKREAINALYTEFPSNPLLICPDLEQLIALSRSHRFPVIVDDTVATFFNTDLISHVDVVCSSLTKYFSGIGNVTGGALILNPDSPFAKQLCAVLNESEINRGNCWHEDLQVLEQNSRDFAERMPIINRNTEQLVDHLQTHPQIETVYYPKYQQPDLYQKYLKPGGGYSGLFSLLLKEASNTAPRFFDALEICKGPNLGTNYTLGCPYTILAHYRELDFAESCGVSRNLIRVSVGLEDVNELIKFFDRALAKS